MPNYQIKRSALQLGVRIVAVSEPSKGVVYELTEVHPTGYDSRFGGNRSFIEYDFKVADDSAIKPPYGGGMRSLTLNFINQHFALI